MDAAQRKSFIETIVDFIRDETARKARDNYKYENGTRIQLSENEFAVKLRAVSHIDELAEVSKATNHSDDARDHNFANDGFEYRTAYFEDHDGKYYKITLSVGKSNGIATVYNVGKIKEDQLPSVKLMTVVGSKPLGKRSSANKISDSSENVKKNFSIPENRLRSLTM